MDLQESIFEMDVATQEFAKWKKYRDLFYYSIWCTIYLHDAYFFFCDFNEIKKNSDKTIISFLNLEYM